MSLFMSQATLRCISVGSRIDVEAMQRAVDAHIMHPVIDSVFPFAEAKAAWAHYAGRDVFGKISRTCTGALRSAFAAEIPAKPPPTMTTTGTIDSVTIDRLRNS